MRKVAIVGKGPTAVLAPFSDYSWEIWGLSWVVYPREDRTFDIHEPGWTDEPEHLAISRAKPLPVTGHVGGDYPNAVPFPFDEVRTKVSSFLESSISYMVALAILEEVDEIGLWGVHMEQRTEYFEQLPSLMYLLGIAVGKGIKITIAPGCPLFLSNWECGYYGSKAAKRRF